jgi:hypothetical protein
MRHIKPRQSFLNYLEGRKLINVDIEEVKPEPVAVANTPAIDERFKKLVEYTRQYRHYQKLYFAKLKKGEFAGDEKHFMMKYQEKIDTIFKHINI